MVSRALDELLKVAEFIYRRRLGPGLCSRNGYTRTRGLSSRELLRAVRRIVNSANLVAMDVVEVAPAYDGPGAITAEVAHRLVLEALSVLAMHR